MNFGLIKSISKINTSYVKFETTKIINRKGSEVAVRYQPEVQMFEKEFGVHNLSVFLQMLSQFENVELTFKDENILIKDAGSKSVIKYRTTSPALMTEYVERDKKAERMMETAKVLVSQKPHVHFKLTETDIRTLSNMGSLMRTSDSIARLAISRKKDSQEILLSVSAEKNDNGYDTVIPITEAADGIDDFTYSFNIENLLPGNWDCYIFSKEFEIDKEGLKIPMIKLGEENIPVVYMYMVDKEQKLDMIITYLLKK